MPVTCLARFSRAIPLLPRSPGALCRTQLVESHRFVQIITKHIYARTAIKGNVPPTYQGPNLGLSRNLEDLRLAKR